MIKTGILLGVEGNNPIWYPSTGLAKNMKCARWLFSYLGWNNQEAEFPVIADINKVTTYSALGNSEDAALFVHEVDTIWVLGSAMILN